MVTALTILVVKVIFALALATFALAWLAGLLLCVAFIARIWRRTDSIDPLEWLAHLRSFRTVGAPREIARIQSWMHRVWRAAFAAVLVAAVSGITLALLATAHGQ
jgi:hypothetical protein